MKRILLCLVLVCTYSITHGQQEEIDSIKRVVATQSQLDQVKSLNELAWYYRNFDIDSAFYFANMALNIGIEQHSQAAISQSYNSLANNYEAIGNLDSALLLFQKVLDIKISLNDTLGLAGAQNNIGLVYDEKSNYPESLDHYFKSLRLYESIDGQEFNTAMVLGNIGIVYKKQKDFDKSFEYYESALKFYKLAGSEFGETVTNGNIGNLLIQLKRFKESIEYSELALNGYRNMGYSRYEPYMLANIGIAFDSLNQTSKAKEYYNLALSGHKDHDNQFEITNVTLLLSKNYGKSGQHTKALELAQQALKSSVSLDALDFQLKATYELAENNFALGNVKLGSAFLSKYDSLKDVLYEEQKSKQIVEVEVKYQTEKKEQKIALQAAELEAKDLELQRNTILLTALILILIMTIISIVLWRKREVEKQHAVAQEQKIRLREAQMTAVVESQEKERKRFAADLHDGMGQLIAALQVNIQSLKTTNDAEKQDGLYENSRSLLKDIHTEIRNIAFNLMPQTLVKEGLISAIEELVIKINRAGKVKVQFSHLDAPQLNEVAQISIYRIIQEFISNILKHGDANKIVIDITGHDNELVLSIEDDGSGFDKRKLENGEGNGWRNINTRLSLINAHCEINSIPNKKGNSILIDLPISNLISNLTNT
ncbi:tetratricopeptide repeat-containing sensor histidine kinase [Fulvivirga lutimaris]|uniref:tetratricopeptide repeat-containing sensor histidine kinase n=1 Tax=Fulvivirga lutimaris TaxID=1819566 RepID=UPI0012BC6BCB|nr:tetratricopeptide repeat protein [Fulvivirga lutimaris]MTI41239.1 tetratricopeptide repeat protein [Fulvivirga lutimaris]